MNEEIKSIINESIQTKLEMVNDDHLIDTIHECVLEIIKTFKQGNKLLFCGNGGSAADAQHLAAEFTGRFFKNRKALPAEALHVNSSYVTAVANDYGFDQIYARLLDGIGAKGDVLVAISTSGNSPNIINAVLKAREIGMVVISFTGVDGGEIAPLSDYRIQVPSHITPRIQESHILIGHIICELVEKGIF